MSSSNQCQGGEPARWRSTRRRLKLQAFQASEQGQLEEAQRQQASEEAQRQQASEEDHILKVKAQQQEADRLKLEARQQEEKAQKQEEEARKEEEEARLKAEKARRKAQWDNGKAAHFYWDGSPLSFLHSLTIRSFHRHNPEWHIKIHTPHAAQRFQGGKTWSTSEQTGVYSGTDYWPHVQAMSFVEICPVDMQESFGFPNDVPEVFKSDFLRWHLLYNEGGLWSDFDILYVKPIGGVLCIEDIDVVLTLSGTGRHNHHIIGFYIAKPKTAFFKTIVDLASGKSQNFNRGGYQTLGSNLIGEAYGNIESVHNEHPNLNILNLPMSAVYPFDSAPGSIANLLTGAYTNTAGHIKDDTIGVHWYNGHPSAKTFISNFENGLRNFCSDTPEPNPECNLLTHLSQEYLEYIV